MITTSVVLLNLVIFTQGKIRTKLKESQVFTIKLPAQPYQYKEGEGFVSQTETDAMKQSLMGRNDLQSVLNTFKSDQSIINIPTKFLSNGKPGRIKYTSENQTEAPTTTSTTTTPATTTTTSSATTTTALSSRPTSTVAFTIAPQPTVSPFFPKPLFYPTPSIFHQTWTPIIHSPSIQRPSYFPNTKNRVVPASTTLIKPPKMFWFPRIQFLPVFNPYQHFFRRVGNYFHG